MKEFDLGPVSAYALAVEQGFSGTLDEWLASLSARIGGNGHWWIGDKDTGVLADPAQLQELTQQAQAAQTAAEDAAGAAAESAEAAQRSASNAASAASAAADSASAAKTAQEAATKSASAAADSAEAAQTSAEAASKSAAEAAGSATAAQNAQTAAEAAQTKADADAEATAEARQIVESAADAEQGRAEAEAARVAADAERTEAITTIADGLSALRARENVLTGSASGTIVSVEDAAAAPLCGLHIYGKSVQDGTPSPDNPVPIVSVGDSGTVAVKVTGKNILDLEDVNEQIVPDKGLTVAVKDGIVTLKGTAIATGGIRLTLNTPTKTMQLLPNNVYTFNPNPIVGTESANCYMDFTNSANCAFSLASQTINKPIRVTAEQAKFKLTFSIWVLKGATIDIQWAPQMLCTDTLLPYEPYHEQLLTLSTPGGLPGIPVDSGGTYTDADGQQWVCDEIDLVHGVYVQRVKDFTIDAHTAIGSVGEWETTYLDAVQPFRLLDFNMAPQRVLCDKLPSCETAWLQDSECIGNIDSMLDFYVSNDRLGTTKDSTARDVILALKTWLAANPLSCKYVLAAPIERPLTDDEIAAYKAPTTYAPTTVVQADGAHIALNYQRDMNIVIKNLEDAIASITTN